MSIRRGFTIVELLVVVSIIGILMALIIPAVQSSRESARQSECLNKIRQVGIALQSYHAQQKSFPAGAIYRADPASPGAPHSSARWSTLVMILPYLENNTLHKQLRLDLPLYSGLGVHPEHTGKVSQVLSEFLCASDTSYEQTPGFGPTNFAVCTGSGSNSGNPFDTDGIFGVNSAIKDAHIVDGLSKTALVSESVMGIGNESLSDPAMATAQGDYAYTLITPLSASMCAGAKQFNVSNRRGFSWANGEYRTTLYNHYLTPNSETFDCIANQLIGTATTRFAVHGWRTARSRHRGGNVGMVMADTSTKTVADTIDPTVWQAWSTRKGGETVGAE
jgi:prepilin-type N-terminal cleavage/methylation domain-containing protein